MASVRAWKESKALTASVTMALAFTLAWHRHSSTQRFSFAQWLSHLKSLSATYNTPTNDTFTSHPPSSTDKTT